MLLGCLGLGFVCWFLVWCWCDLHCLWFDVAVGFGSWGFYLYGYCFSVLLVAVWSGGLMACGLLGCYYLFVLV